MSYTVYDPIQTSLDPDLFAPLAGGTVYFGVPNGNPQAVVGDRVQVYLARQGLADLAISQPVSIGPGGHWYYNGNPAQIKILVPYCVQAFNSLGVQEYYAPSGGDDVSKFNEIDAALALSIKTVDTFADLSSTDADIGQQVSLKGYSTQGDGGGGIFNVVSSVGVTAADGLKAINGGVAFIRDPVTYQIMDFNNNLQTAFNALSGAEQTGYGASNVILDLYGREITFTGDLFVPTNITLINGKIKSTTGGRLVFRNPYLANTALRAYTEYWPYMTGSCTDVEFNCTVIFNCYIGRRFYNCNFSKTYSLVVFVNSNGLWTEYNTFVTCDFAAQAGDAAIIFDGNSAGTSIYSTGTGAGTPDGSFGYNSFDAMCKIDSTAPKYGIKMTGGAVFYNGNIHFRGYARGNGPTGGFLYVDDARVAQCDFKCHFESFASLSIVINVTATGQFWYNTGTIQSASPEMTFIQDALADVRNNNIYVIGCELADSSGAAVFLGDTYRTVATSSVRKRQWITPVLSVYPSINVNFTHNLLSLVPFNTAAFDNISKFGSNKYTPNVAGYYQINSKINITASGAATSAAIYLYFNGAEIRRSVTGTVGAEMEREVNALIRFNGSTDYIEIYVFTFDNTTTPQITGGIKNSYLNAHLVLAD